MRPLLDTSLESEGSFPYRITCQSLKNGRCRASADLFKGLLFLVLLSSLTGCHRPAAAPDEAEGVSDEPKVVVAVKVASAQREPIGSDVVASGIVVPLPDRQATVNAGTAGKVTSLLVQTGDRVKKGQPLVQLDTARLQSQVRQAQAALAAARSQVAQASLDVLSQEQSYRGGVQAAESSLRTAELNLSKLREGARPQEVAQAEAAVSQAEATLNNARSTRDRMNTLFQHGVAAKKDAQDADTQFLIAQGQLKSARESLSLLRAGARPQEIADAQVQVRQARNALQLAQASRVNTQAKEEAMRSLRDQARGAEAALAAARADLSLATVRSPISGVVIQRLVTPGASVDLTVPLMTLADLSEVEFQAQVQPQDFSRVRAGQRATLTVPAFPNRSGAGTVFQVAQTADPKTNTVPTRIRFANPGGWFKNQMYGTARIHAVQRRSIVVPSSAALTDEDGSYVLIVNAKGNAKRKSVKTGLVEGGKTEIVSGLSEGEKVITSGNYGMEDGTKVTIQP
jgi:HlyD family secretion protein